MAYRTWQQWRQRCGSNVNTTITAEVKTWLGNDSRAAARQHRDGSDSNSSGANMDLWQRLLQVGSNGCDNTAAEQTWLNDSVSNSIGSSETSSTVAERTWLTGPGSSGNREVAAISRQKQRRRINLGFLRQQGGGEATARWQ